MLGIPSITPLIHTIYMNYDLTQKEERKRFIRRANLLLRKERSNVSLVDESNRTVNQNNYLHVLCRILAEGTGTTEWYAKQVYFKELANPEIFSRITKDPLTNKMVKITRSSSELSVQEMSKALDNFIRWAAEQGYALPAASLNIDGSIEFNSDLDATAFHQAEIITSKAEAYL